MTNKKSELTRGAGKAVPSSQQELGTRISAVIDMYPRKMDAAEVAGVTVEQLKRYVRDQSVPPFDVLARLAGPKGVNLNWLADGKGPMFGAAATTRSMPYQDAWEEELVGRISDGIARIYKEEGAKLAPVDQGRLIARIAGRLTTTYDDQAERLIGLKLALEEVRADLRKAPLAEAPSSKRSA